MSSVNPDLITFLQSATLAARDNHNSNSESTHIKKLHLFFILSLMMYCTHPHKPTAIHNLLADVVEVCGGSRQLLRILNRMGITSSPDTHDRFVTYQAEIHREKSIWESLPETVFTIASTDNFDMLQSYAAVYCGDHQRSYHGTTVQLVQPHYTLLVSETSSQSSMPHEVIV